MNSATITAVLLSFSCVSLAADGPTTPAAAAAKSPFEVTVRPGVRLTVEKSGGVTKPVVTLIYESNDLPGKGRITEAVHYEGGDSSVGGASGGEGSGKRVWMAGRTDVIRQVDGFKGGEPGHGERFVRENGLVVITVVFTQTKDDDGQPLAEPRSYPVATIVFHIKNDGRWTNSPVEQKWDAR